MILYVNGDSHTAAAEAVNPHAFAMDDGELFYMGRAPHPANLAVSWGKLLSQTLRASFHCGAEAGGSNARILRTTRDWLEHTPVNQDLLIIIQWSTWEREEWHHQGQYYSIMDNWYKHLPPELSDRYHAWVKTNSPEKLEQNARAFHEQIYQLHKFLQESNIPHLFYNCMYNFFGVKPAEQKDWNNCYIGPYDNDASYYWYLKKQGYESDHWYHFGPDGHQAWADFLVNYINDHDLIR